ncbi:MAG: GNAT family N-acetyltransferase [Flavobacteriaceae bacterium]
MKFEITQITAEDTYPLRHTLLRKGRPLSSCILEGDDAPETIHLGAFFDNNIIGIGSAFLNPCPQYPEKIGVQLRAIAVAPYHQRKGVATQLIQQLLKKIQFQLNPECIWLNARISANLLYLSNGFQPVGDPFEIVPIGTHQRFIKNYSHDE